MADSPEAMDALFSQAYEELRRLASAVRRNGAGPTLGPTALVHEAWLRLVPDRAPAFADRAHFLRAAAAAMRSVLVDHIRARATQKRGGGRQRVELHAIADVYQEQAVDLVGLDEALQRLGARRPARQRVPLRPRRGKVPARAAQVRGRREVAARVP